MKREWRHGVAPFYDDVLLSRLLFLAVFLYYSVCFVQSSLAGFAQVGDGFFCLFLP